MNVYKCKKTLIFTLLTLVFCAFSLFMRDLLVSGFNNLDAGIFKIDYIKNYGAAFSLFHTHTSFLITVSICILFAALYYILTNIKSFTKSDIFFCALLCAGIICNLSERLLDGFVTDYIRLNFIVFPIFNISDVFISIGAFALICNILFNNEQERN